MYFGVSRYLQTYLTRQLGRSWRGKVYLTYDDGPGLILQPKLLKLLKAHQVKATFFLSGYNAVSYPDGVAQIANDGHQIGSHTQNHRRIGWVFPWLGWRDIREGVATLERLGVETKMFRPPFGELPFLNWVYLRLRRFQITYWTLSAEDRGRYPRTPESIVNELILNKGGIVLLHSHDCGPEHEKLVLEVTQAVVTCPQLTVGILPAANP